MADEKTSWWQKAGVLLQPVGGLFTALAVAVVGIVGSKTLNDQQARETDVRIYAELMSKREEADSNLRKDMFKSILETFLQPGSGQLENKVLNLELLAYNFHESLDLGPLFKHTYKQIDPSTPAGKGYLERLEKVAREINDREVRVLSEEGAVKSENVDFDKLSEHPEGVRLIETDLQLPPSALRSTDERQPRHFMVEVLDMNSARKELQVHLKISSPGNAGAEPEVDSIFWVGAFDFPMIDNARLSRGQRCAVTLNRFSKFGAQITLVYFPGSRASVKDKPYYDEVIHELLRTRDKTEK